MADEILNRDAIGQAAAIAAGEITAVELLEIAIERAAARNPVVNAISIPLCNLARRQLSQGEVGRSGPFAGVPFLLKDFYSHMSGTPTTASSRLLQDNIVDHDSVLTQRYRDAGLVIFGKTNVPEMVTIGTTEPLLYGPTRNPFSHAHSAGGSSGGAAAAVAAGIVAMAHANDGAGSIRIPASYCGLYGLKPTRGRITLGPDVGESIGGVTSEHVVTRSARDSAAILDATAGPSAGDPYFAPLPSETCLAAVQRHPGNLRIAVSTTPMFEGTTTDPEIAAAVERAAASLTENGFEVIERNLPIDRARFTETFRRFWPMTISRAAYGLAQSRGMTLDAVVAELEPLNQHMVGMGIGRPAVDYISDLIWFQTLSRQTAAFLSDVDVLLTPTVAHPPPPLGQYDAAKVGGATAFDRVMDSFAYTCLANVTGLPAASLPFGQNSAGLPIGLQLTAPFGEENRILSLSHWFETAHPWSFPHAC